MMDAKKFVSWGLAIIFALVCIVLFEKLIVYAMEKAVDAKKAYASWKETKWEQHEEHPAKADPGTTEHSEIVPTGVTPASQSSDGVSVTLEPIAIPQDYDGRDDNHRAYLNLMKALATHGKSAYSMCETKYYLVDEPAESGNTSKVLSPESGSGYKVVIRFYDSNGKPLGDVRFPFGEGNDNQVVPGLASALQVWTYDNKPHKLGVSLVNIKEP